MGLRKRNPEGPGLPIPEAGARRLLALFHSYFWKLLGANLLFVLFSLPVVTLPGALCALNRVCILIYREGHCFLWMDFWKEFKSSALRSILLGLLFGGILFAGYYMVSLAAANMAFPLFALIFWTLGILAVIISICWGAYFFVLMPMLDLKVGQILKNSLFLCFIRPQRALLVLGVVVLMSFIAAICMPVFVIALALCWFVFMQYVICYLVYGMADQYILQPFEAQQNNM